MIGNPDEFRGGKSKDGGGGKLFNGGIEGRVLVRGGGGGRSNGGGGGGRLPFWLRIASNDGGGGMSDYCNWVFTTSSLVSNFWQGTTAFN